MSRPIEELLRDAYQAKAAQLTEARLEQLTAAREHGLDELLGTEQASEHTAELPAIQPDGRPGRRSHRWIAPALAAAAVAAVAIGAVVIATDQPAAHQRPNPAATHVSSSPEPSSTPTPTPSTTPTATVAAPPYLPAGQTGNRDQVPWSAVGPGWRLLQPESGGDYVYFDPHLYLYDPAGGRYLITSTLPIQSNLGDWSPDGRRALIEDNRTLRQLDLRTGQFVSAVSLPNGNFVAYTRPQGLAMLVDDFNAVDPPRLLRYATDGMLEFKYPAVINGQRITGYALYTQDGSELILPTATGSTLLVGNDGHYIRTFPRPDGYPECTPVKLWTAGSFLLRCQRTAGNTARGVLIVQPLSGAAPHVLADSQAGNTDGYQDAWQLSNGDVLLDSWHHCAGSTYDVLDGSTGVIRPLRWPAGVDRSTFIAEMSGDDATFQARRYGGSCGEGVPQSSVYSYNMLTGQTNKLLDGDAVVLGWPGGQI